MYVKYCENKPKSELIVTEFIDFFEVFVSVLILLIAGWRLHKPEVKLA
jgi:hypothetical protein